MLKGHQDTSGSGHASEQLSQPDLLGKDFYKAHLVLGLDYMTAPQLGRLSCAEHVTIHEERFLNRRPKTLLNKRSLTKRISLSGGGVGGVRAWVMVFQTFPKILGLRGRNQ